MTQTARDPALAALDALDLHGLKILFVDDDVDVIQLVKRFLANAGAVVATATSAADALRRFHEMRPDVIVSDIAMPNVDGYDLIRAVRATGAATPAIALTAHTRKQDRTQALEAGYNLHMAKPMRMVELIMSISRVVGRSAPSRR